jgi:ParB family chromosome partitioning protein
MDTPIQEHAMSDHHAVSPSSVGAFALPPSVSAIGPGRAVTMMPIAAITVRTQVRTQFDQAALGELAQSIKAVGILQPVLVRREGKALILVDGERRLRAAIQAGLAEVPVIVVDADGWESPHKVVQVQLIANLQRRDLNPIELARGLAQLRDLTGWSITDLANRVGPSIASVSRSLALLDLAESVQAQVESGRLAASAALKLRKLDPERQTVLAVEAAGLSRKGVERLVRRRARTPDGFAAPRIARSARSSRGPRSLLAVGPLRVQVNAKASPSDVVAALQQLSDLARALSLLSPDLPPFLEALCAELKPTSEVSPPVAIDQ